MTGNTLWICQCGTRNQQKNTVCAFCDCERVFGDHTLQLTALKEVHPSERWLVSFQERVAPWMQLCFGPVISADKVERSDRFLEEALELVQAAGCSKARALQLVDYVYDRDVGLLPQEIGGVMVTLAALCLAHGMDMHECGEIELHRINMPENVEKIRAKQKSKADKIGPLPQPVDPDLLTVQIHRSDLSRLDKVVSLFNLIAGESLGEMYDDMWNLRNVMVPYVKGDEHYDPELEQ